MSIARKEFNKLFKSGSLLNASRAVFGTRVSQGSKISSINFSTNVSSCTQGISALSSSSSYKSITTVSSKKQFPNVLVSIRLFSSEVKSIPVPGLGDSITEGTVVSFTKAVGDSVQVDEVIAVLETDKVSVDIRSPAAGVLTELSAKPGDTIKVGDTLFKLQLGAVAAAKPADAPKAEAPKTEAPKAEAPKAEAPKAEAPKTEAPKAEAPKAEAPKAEAPKKEASKAEAKPAAKSSTPVKGPAPTIKTGTASRNETRVPMSRMRLRIAERLKDAQNTYALLTTFNEIDMTNAMNVRSKYKDAFQQKHNSKLGFMSFFVKAATSALINNPTANAAIEGKDIVYRDFVDISVAVATPNGLVVPVLRNTEQMGFHDVENAIAALGEKARKGQIAIEDMVGGTFTISNGGVYGSLMGTPIVNPPQSAILGMHGIFKRPVVVDDKIEIRPMMYVALTYDHRLLDGSDAVTFLRKIKDNVEDPVRLLLDV